jgi:hypothetical protein
MIIINLIFLHFPQNLRVWAIAFSFFLAWVLLGLVAVLLVNKEAA